jgi:hypothetical protein
MAPINEEGHRARDIDSPKVEPMFAAQMPGFDAA